MPGWGNSLLDLQEKEEAGEEVKTEEPEIIS